MIELPQDLKKRGVHPAFHASLLRIHVPNDDRLFPGRTAAQLGITKIFDTEWKVDRILDHSGRGIHATFQVEWPTGDRTWIDYDTAKNLVVLEQYLESLGIKDISQLTDARSTSEKPVELTNSHIQLRGIRNKKKWNSRRRVQPSARSTAENEWKLGKFIEEFIQEMEKIKLNQSKHSAVFKASKIPRISQSSPSLQHSPHPRRPTQFCAYKHTHTTCTSSQQLPRQPTSHLMNTEAASTMLSELPNVLINEERTLLSININDKNKVVLVSFTRSQVEHILSWSRTIFKTPVYDQSKARPAGLKYFLTAINKHPLACRLPQIKNGSVVIEARDIKVPTITEVMGEEFISNKELTKSTPVKRKLDEQDNEMFHGLLKEKYLAEQRRRQISILRRERKAHAKQVSKTWTRDINYSRFLQGEDDTAMEEDELDSSSTAGPSTST